MFPQLPLEASLRGAPRSRRPSVGGHGVAPASQSRPRSVPFCTGGSGASLQAPRGRAPSLKVPGRRPRLPAPPCTHVETLRAALAWGPCICTGAPERRENPLTPPSITFKKFPKPDLMIIYKMLSHGIPNTKETMKMIESNLIFTNIESEIQYQ